MSEKGIGDELERKNKSKILHLEKITTWIGNAEIKSYSRQISRFDQTIQKIEEIKEKKTNILFPSGGGRVG